MAIGFNTPSKRQAEATENNNSPQPQQVSVSYLQHETISRLQQLGNMICSPQFSSLPPEQKELMLNDFAYFTNLANAL